MWLGPADWDRNGSSGSVMECKGLDGQKGIDLVRTDMDRTASAEEDWSDPAGIGWARQMRNGPRRIAWAGVDQDRNGRFGTVRRAAARLGWVWIGSNR